MEYDTCMRREKTEAQNNRKSVVEYIKLYGTLDNFNTEYTEQLHIDLTKDTYAATNHKDEYVQMTLWLECKEKIFQHHQYVQWWLKGSPAPAPEPVEWTPPGLELDCTLHMTKHPSVGAVLLVTLSTQYGTTHFRKVHGTLKSAGPHKGSIRMCYLGCLISYPQTHRKLI